MFGATVTTALLVSDLIALLLTRRPLKPAARTHSQSRATILIVRTSRSGCGRTRSTDSKPLREFGAQHLHPVGKQKAALKLPGGDAAMQIFTRLVLLLPAADRKLVLLNRDLDLVL